MKCNYYFYNCSTKTNMNMFPNIVLLLHTHKMHILNHMYDRVTL